MSAFEYKVFETVEELMGQYSSFSPVLVRDKLQVA